VGVKQYQRIANINVKVEIMDSQKNSERSDSGEFGK
jgi:hypothetical protein